MAPLTLKISSISKTLWYIDTRDIGTVHVNKWIPPVVTARSIPSTQLSTGVQILWFKVRYDITIFKDVNQYLLIRLHGRNYFNCGDGSRMANGVSINSTRYRIQGRHQLRKNDGSVFRSTLVMYKKIATQMGFLLIRQTSVMHHLYHVELTALWTLYFPFPEMTRWNMKIWNCSKRYLAFLNSIIGIYKCTGSSFLKLIINYVLI